MRITVRMAVTGETSWGVLPPGILDSARERDIHPEREAGAQTEPGCDQIKSRVSPHFLRIVAAYSRLMAATAGKSSLRSKGMHASMTARELKV